MAQNTFNPINILDTTDATGVGSGGSLTIGGGASIEKDFYVGGNISVSGTTTSFSDNIILINKNPTNSCDTGLLFERFTNDISDNQNYSSILYSEISDEFHFGYVSSDISRSNATVNSFARIKTNGINSIANSNTIGNIYTTGGNVGINNVSPSYRLDVSGGARISTGITTGTVTATSITNTNNTGYAKFLPSTAHSKRIVVFGSSVAYGTGATNNQGWGYKLGEYVTANGWTFNNVSIGGNTTVNLINRFYTDVVPLQPDVVIIGLSLANEGILNSTGKEGIFEQYISNIFRLVDMCRQQCFKVVVGGTYPNNSYTSVEYNYIKQADKFLQSSQIPYINFLGSVDDGTGKWRSGMFSDGGHPNDVGHTAMYRSIPLTLFDRLSYVDQPFYFTYPISSYIVMTGDSTTAAPIRYTVGSEPIGSWTIMCNVAMVRGSASGVALFSVYNGTAAPLRIRAPDGVWECLTTTLLIQSTVRPDDGLVHQVALTYNYYTDTCTLYVDGVNYGSSSTSSWGANITHFDFLGRVDSVGFNANGMQISNLAVYKVALNSNQIAECYRGMYPKSSLEIFSPCTDTALSVGNSLLNLAYSDARLYINTSSLSYARTISNTTEVNTNVSKVSSNLIATGNSNTVGNIFTTGGNVGIGTTTPQTRLHIGSNIIYGARAGDYLGGNMFWTGTEWSRISSAAAGFSIRIGDTSDIYGNGLQFLVGDTNNTAVSRMLISASGNVGISNTNPQHRLSVNGTVNIATSLTAGSIFATNSTITNSVSTNISSATLNLSSGITAASSQITNSNVTTQTVGASIITTSLRAIGNSNTIGNIYTTGGNVGINNVSPSYTVDVTGNLRVSSVISVSDTTNAPAGAVTGTNVRFSNGGMTYLNQNPPDEYNPSGSTENRPYYYSSSYFVTALTVDPNPDPGYSPYSYFYNPTAFKYIGSSSAVINWRVQTPGANAPMFGTYTIYIDILDTDGATIISTPATLVYSSGSLVTDTGIQTTTLNQNQYIRFRGSGMSATIEDFVFTYDLSTNVNGLIANSSGITTGTLKATSIISTTGTVGTLINTNTVSTNISSATLNLSSGITAASSQIANSNVTTQTVGTSIITTSLIAIGNSNTIGSIYTTGGNVGVNTIAPLSRFNVVGNSNGTNGTVLITGGDEYGHGLHVASQDSLKRLGFNNNGTIGNIFAFNYSTLTSQNLILQYPGGNVGICTTDPSHTLDVNGGLRSTNFTTTNALITGVTTATAQISNLRVSSVISVSDTANAPAGAVTGTNVRFSNGGMSYLNQNPPDEYNPNGSTENRPYYYSSSYFVTALTVDPNPDPGYSPYSYFYNPTAFKYTGSSSAVINWRVQTPGANAPMFGTYTIYVDILDTNGTTIISTPATLVYSSGSLVTDTGIQTTTLNQNQYIRFRGSGTSATINDFIFTYDLSTNVSGLIANSSGVTTGSLTVTGNIYNTPQFAVFEEQQSSGTAPASYSAATYSTRVLNTSVNNTITGSSLSSNQFTLPVGTYKVKAYCPNYAGGYSKAVLYNVTTSSNILYGMNCYANGAASNVTSTFSIISNVFTIATTSTFAVKQYFSVSDSQMGGVAASSGQIETYTHVEITKLA